ncbi:MAG: hypothetical protein KF871_02745 [Hydrogenophaga sp.]|uniref:hypothetical protein n=1 Tax=Hydrogenophaga sp. TaxID=1904254 RepID=UPI001DFE4F5F|nr:hypothetical protein [Hydrogenophaga sp.]MBX3608790.1 hypothetical protein [Hydrogenophaga sp.]
MSSSPSTQDTHPAAEPVDGPVLRVLAVCARGERLQALRDAIARWPVPARLIWSPLPERALASVVADDPDLVVLDARLEPVGGAALRRHLMHLRPHAMVLSFDDEASEPGGHASVWHWCELPAVMRWWAQRRAPAPVLPALASARAPAVGVA